MYLYEKIDKFETVNKATGHLSPTSGNQHLTNKIILFQQRNERYLSNRRLSLAFEYDLLQAFIRKINMHAMPTLEEADSLWINTKTQLLKDIVKNQEVYQQHNSNKNSVFGYKGYNPRNNIIIVYNYLCNRIVDIILDLPEKVEAFINLKQRTNQGIDKPVIQLLVNMVVKDIKTFLDSRKTNIWKLGGSSIQLLVNIFVKDYEEICKSVHSHHPILETLKTSLIITDLSSILFKEASTVFQIFQYYNQQYDASIQLLEEHQSVKEKKYRSKI